MWFYFLFNLCKVRGGFVRTPLAMTNMKLKIGQVKDQLYLLAPAY